MEVNVPSQVDEAAELAEKLHAQMFDQPSQDEVIDDEPVDNQQPDEVDDDSSNEPSEKWEARYKSLKGKYDKEVPRLSHEIREMKEDMFARINSMAEQLKAPQQAPAEQSQEPSQEDLMNEFAETYGEDFTENLRKLIALEAKKLTGDVTEKVNNLEDTQFKTAQTNFKAYINDNLKDTKLDWEACWQGKDPQFLEFLQQPDPSGLYTYGDLAELYNKNWDADKLTAIFKQYINHVEPVQHQPEPKSKPNPQKDAMVAPSRNTVHNAPNTDSKRIWTQDMIQEFQMKDRQGKYTADESKAMWDDMLAALGEGRIR